MTQPFKNNALNNNLPVCYQQSLLPRKSEALELLIITPPNDVEYVRQLKETFDRS